MIEHPVCTLCNQPWSRVDPCCSLGAVTYCVDCCTRELHADAGDEDE